MSARRSSGLALVATLWLVAALSIAVLALSRSVRNETRGVGLGRQMLQAQAEADAAIHLLVQDIRLGSTALDASRRQSIDFQGHTLDVLLSPLSGWIDINAAPASLMARAIELLSGADATKASALAQAVVDYRAATYADGTRRRFVSLTDLLRVPGWTLDTWLLLAPAFTAHSGTSGAGANPYAAPLPVLIVLADGNRDLAQRIHQQVAAGEPGIDMTGLNAGFVSRQSSRLLHARVSVVFQDGQRIHVNRLVDMGGISADGLSWRIIPESVRAEPMASGPLTVQP